MNTSMRVQRSLYLERLQNKATPIKVPASPVMKTLGYGTGVNVYRLERSPKRGITQSPWAIKRVSKRTDQEYVQILNERIRAEAETLRKLSHPNIIGYRGITKSTNGIETLMLECCGNSLGSILEERYESKFGPLESVNTLKVIRDISLALDYLHTVAKILHGDMKSFNILVKGDFEICKLCDFGVCLPLDEKGFVDFGKNPHLRYVGTNIWSAPEIMEDAEIIDTKADIFSFGLVIYETITLHPPHTVPIDDDDDNEVEDLHTNSSIIEIGDSSTNSIVEIGDSATNSIVEIGETSTNSIDEGNSTKNDYNDSNINLSLISEKTYDSACGTRPPLPMAFELTDNYNLIVELFYHCTHELAENRPTAKIIYKSLENNIEIAKSMENNKENEEDNAEKAEKAADK